MNILKKIRKYCLALKNTEISSFLHTFQFSSEIWEKDKILNELSEIL